MSAFYIPEPCHENWNQMTPQEQGRHCAVCSKVVVDFTKKSEPEINQVMAEAEGRVCGHFTVAQLNQEAQRSVFRKPGNIFNRNFKYFALTFLGIFVMGKRGETQKLKGKVAIRGDVAPVNEPNTNIQVTRLSGTVTNKEGKPVRGAVIHISSGGEEIAQSTSIANGVYSVKLPAGKIVNKKVDVMVWHPAYEAKEVMELAITKEAVRLNISMDEYVMLMGIVAPVRPEPVPPTPPTDSIPETPVAPIPPAPPVPPVDNILIPEPVAPTCNEMYPAETTDVQTTHTHEGVSEIVLYPNPAHTHATLYCTRDEKYRVEVYDAKGTLNHQVYFTGMQKQLDINSYEPGTYIVRITGTTGEPTTIKLVKN